MKDRSIVETMLEVKLCDSVFSELLLKMKLGESEMHIGMTFFADGMMPLLVDISSTAVRKPICRP